MGREHVVGAVVEELSRCVAGVVEVARHNHPVSIVGSAAGAPQTAVDCLNGSCLRHCQVPGCLDEDLALSPSLASVSALTNLKNQCL